MLGIMITFVLRHFIASSQGNNVQDSAWHLDRSLGFPFWEALNVEKPRYSSRHIFLFLEAEYFTEENLRKIFSTLPSQYNSSQTLYITIYSDKERLQWAIENDRQPIMADPPPTLDDDARKSLEKKGLLPRTTGYFRAGYVRMNGEESFSYSPDAEKEGKISVILRPRPGPSYTGEINSDLLLSSQVGDTSKIETLLAEGANKEISDEDGDTPLMIAALKGHIAAVRALLMNGAKADAKNKSGDTALIYAAGVGNKEIVLALLNHGADINVVNSDKYSPLIMAAANGHTPVVQTLLEKDIDKSQGKIALRVAKRNGYDDIVQLLKRRLLR
jgi:hypothetical protein